MNLSPDSHSSFTVSLYPSSPASQTSPKLTTESKTESILKVNLPQVLKKLGDRIGIEKESSLLLEKKEVSSIKTFNETNQALQAVLVKMHGLLEKRGVSSGEIKDLDAKVSQIEEHLFVVAKQGSLSSHELKEEIKLIKDFHKVLLSMNDYLNFQQAIVSLMNNWILHLSKSTIPYWANFMD